jgi:beta-lactamase regulating signal transducer with metallopeptidase domain
MSDFTIAYAYRLAIWWLLFLLIQGGLILLSWRLWGRVLTNSEPARRYWVALLHFVALLSLPLASLMVLHFAAGAMGAAGMHGVPRTAPLPVSASNSSAIAAFSLMLIVWLAGLGWSLLRIFSDLRAGAGQMFRPAPEMVAQAVRALTPGFRGARIPILAVADVTGPQVVGLRQPTLLLPGDFDLNFSRDEQNALLLHELSHVARRDFLWNFLLRVFSAILWFYPVVGILRRSIDIERERCCDALAVRHGAEPVTLARALVRLTEHYQIGLGMRATGSGDLTGRVHKLLGLRDPAAAGGGPLAAVIVGCLACGAIAAAAQAPRLDPSTAGLHNGSVFGTVISIDARDPGGTFTLSIKQGRVVGARLDGIKLMPGQILQRGRDVVLIDSARHPVVALQVAPQGAFRWKARRPT